MAFCNYKWKFMSVHKTFIDGLPLCGLLRCFYQLFGILDIQYVLLMEVESVKFDSTRFHKMLQFSMLNKEL